MPPPGASALFATASFRDSRAHCRQFGETIDGFTDGPGEAAQDEDAEERVVEGPGVMAGDRDEDAAFALLARPEQRLGSAFFNARGKHTDVFLISNEVPVALVDDVQVAQSRR